MLLIVFGLLLSLTVGFLVLGHYWDAPFFKLSGSVFLFSLGLILLFGGITHQTGLTEATTYSYAGGNLSLTNTTTSYIYSDIGKDIINGLDVTHVFGFLLTVLSVFIFMYSFFEIRKPREID